MRPPESWSCFPGMICGDRIQTAETHSYYEVLVQIELAVLVYLIYTKR